MVYAVRTIICQQCGKRMEGRYSAKRQFCSVECRQAYRNHPDRNPAKRPEVRQKISEGMQGHKRCVGRVVSAETRQKISKSLTGKTQSAEHIANRTEGLKRAREKRGGISPRRKAHLDSIHKSGAEHPNWKGGISPYRMTHYFRDARYKPFRSAVLNRDDWTCQECGKRGGRLQVHHVIPYADCPERAFDVDNGITLCKKCHYAKHRGQPRPGG